MNVRSMPRDDEYLSGPDADYLTRMFCQLRGNFPGRKQFSVLALDRVGETKANVIDRDMIVDLPDGGFRSDDLFVCTFITKDQYPWHAEERCLSWLMVKLKEEALWRPGEEKMASRLRRADVDANNNCSNPSQNLSHAIHIFTYYSPCWKCSDQLREMAQFLRDTGLSKTVRVTVGFLEPYVPLEGTQEKSESCLEKMADLQRDFKDFVTLGYLPPAVMNGASKKTPLYYGSLRQMRPPLQDITGHNNGRWKQGRINKNEIERVGECGKPMISRSRLYHKEIAGSFSVRERVHHLSQASMGENHAGDEFFREPRGGDYFKPEYHHSTWENDVIGGKHYRPSEVDSGGNERYHHYQAPKGAFREDEYYQEDEHPPHDMPRGDVPFRHEHPPHDIPRGDVPYMPIYHSARPLDRNGSVTEDYKENYHYPHCVPWENFDNFCNEGAYLSQMLENNFAEDVGWDTFEQKFQEVEEKVRHFRPAFGKQRVRRRFLGRDIKNLAPYARHWPASLPPQNRHHFHL